MQIFYKVERDDDSGVVTVRPFRLKRWVFTYTLGIFERVRASASGMPGTFEKVQDAQDEFIEASKLHSSLAEAAKDVYEQTQSWVRFKNSKLVEAAKELAGFREETEVLQTRIRNYETNIKQRREALTNYMQGLPPDADSYYRTLRGIYGE